MRGGGRVCVCVCVGCVCWGGGARARACVCVGGGGARARVCVCGGGGGACVCMTFRHHACRSNGSPHIDIIKLWANYRSISKGLCTPPHVISRDNRHNRNIVKIFSSAIEMP